MIASTKSSVCENVCDHIELLNETLISHIHATLQIVEGHSLEVLIVDLLINTVKQAEIRSTGVVITVGQDSLDVVECINAEVVPTHIDGDVLCVCNCGTVVVTNGLKSACSTKPVVSGRAGHYGAVRIISVNAGNVVESPVGISIACIAIVEQNSEFLYTHRGDSKLAEVNVLAGICLKSGCYLGGISIRGSTHITKVVKICLGCCQGILRNFFGKVAQVTVTVGVRCTDGYVVDYSLFMAEVCCCDRGNGGCRRTEQKSKNHNKRENLHCHFFDVHYKILSKGVALIKILNKFVV